MWVRQVGILSNEFRATPRTDHSRAKSELPAELTVLNYVGVPYSRILKAWQLAKQQNQDPYEILIKSRIVTHEQWSDAQKFLAERRRIAYEKQKFKARLLKQAVLGLDEMAPHYSARQTCSTAQIWRYAAYLGVMAFLLANAFETVTTLFFIFLSAFYLAVILMRAGILAEYRRSQIKKKQIVISNSKSPPIYTVMVAMHKEKDQVKELCHHLYKLDWPKDKLDIKLICEADDFDTIAAVLSLKLPKCFQLVTVPPAEPRTKPKALNFALPLARGEFLVLYDAEDRPAPTQLREAYARFLADDGKLACVQAPLHIHNKYQNWLTAMFAIEYMTLFNGILPALAKWKVPLPLGGTSNHFRIDILREIGGWDPFNVTEDADLGVRIFREGYFTSTIRSPTYEEAPPEIGIWVRQRTRWLKGWMQTLIVHAQTPISLTRQIGFKNTIAYHLMLTAIVISVMFHPILIAGFVVKFIGLAGSLSTSFDAIFVATSAFNMVGGYTTYSLLVYVVLRTNREHLLIPFITFLPLYWLLVSFASWRALFHLITKPHHWEKTPHGLATNDFRITN